MKLVDRLLIIRAEEDAVAWRDQMIRELREALKFYADATNYEQGWLGARRQRTLVDIDSGKIARNALCVRAEEQKR